MATLAGFSVCGFLTPSGAGQTAPPSGPAGPPAADRRNAAAEALPAPETIPVTAEHHYRLSGAARPFVLFWIDRDDVGAGRMTWGRAADGTISLEMLSGSDPGRAPLGTNRWGYVREVVRGDSAEILEIRSEAEDETIAEAEARATRQDDDRLFVFVRERVTSSDARAWTALADVGREVSYRDLDFALERMEAIDDWTERRLGAPPPGTRPGFLTAFTQLMQATLDAAQSGTLPPRHSGHGPLTYIYRARLYELRQDRIELVRGVRLGGRRYARALEGRFRIQNRSTGEPTEFVVVYGVDAELAGVPLQIRFRPRWWLRATLTLDDTIRVPSATARATGR